MGIKKNLIEWSAVQTTYVKQRNVTIVCDRAKSVLQAIAKKNLYLHYLTVSVNLQFNDNFKINFKIKIIMNKKLYFCQRFLEL